MARTVADLELALDLISGPDRWNSPAWRLELPAPRSTDAGRLRVATWFEDPACRLDPEVATALHGFVVRLVAAGVRVERGVTPGFDLTKANERFQALVTAAVSGGFSPGQIEEFALAVGDDPVAVAKLQSSMRHRQWLSHHEGRLQLRRRFETFFEDHDILLLPVMPCVAFAHDHSEPMAARVVPTQLGAQRLATLEVVLGEVVDQHPADATSLPHRRAAAGHRHPHRQSAYPGGVGQGPRIASASAAKASVVRSCRYGPTICTPTGRPDAASPTGITVAGR
jgi:Asp-tRNA(Asn)/Glu-tRNA(Gln) amidotransferase A subunit family amidase